MGSSESLPTLLATEAAATDPTDPQAKAFKSTFAKELEEGAGANEKEEEERRREEVRRRRREQERRAVEEGSRAAGREYSRLREENAELKLEILKIQMEEKRFRDLQHEVDQLSWQLRKVGRQLFQKRVLTLHGVLTKVQITDYLLKLEK